MIYTELTEKALKLCFTAHKEQTDKNGIPYVFHPFHLAEQMNDELSVVVALLHDVVEDTDLSLEDLAQMGFPREVTEAISLLTHAPNLPYEEYLIPIKANHIARRVKLADLHHNTDQTRLRHPSPHIRRKWETYRKAIAFLSEES